MNVGDPFYPVSHNLLNHGLMLVQLYTVFPLARWGYPEEKGVSTGAELWAWMGQGTST